jgi:putative transposase
VPPSTSAATASRRPAGAADAVLTAKITVIHAGSSGTYGSPRVHQVLRRDGAGCGKRRVARLMRAAGLEGRRKKRWRVTTIPGPAAEQARDLIRRDFAPSGWAYLATVVDLSSRRVVGWARADHMRTSLVEDALSMAFAARRPAGARSSTATAAVSLGSRGRRNTALLG